MANRLIETNAAALAALADKATGDPHTAAEYTTFKDAVQEINGILRAANTVYAGPTSGAAATGEMRPLVVADIPALSYQPVNAALTALAALDATAGLLEQTGANTFARRALGVGASTSIPTRADADTRYAAASHAHSAAEITSGTLPDGRFPATLPAVSGANLTALNASNLASGTVPSARLGSGTADDTTVLYGDGVWREPAGGGAGPVFTTQVQFIDGTMSAPGATFGGTTEGWCRRSPGILSYVIGAHVVMEHFGSVMQVGLNGGVHWCAGPPEETPWDTGIECAAVGAALKATKNGGNGYAQVRMDSLGVANSAAATTPGTVTKKIEVFSEAGASLGFLPVYDAIT